MRVTGLPSTSTVPLEGELFAEHKPQQRAFAASRFAELSDKFAGWNFKVQPGEHRLCPASARIGNRDIAQRDLSASRHRNQRR